MKAIRKVLIGVTVATLMVGGLAACKHRDYTPAEKVAYVVEEIDDELELTELQLTNLKQLANIVTSLAEEAEAKREQHHNTIDELLSQPTLDQARILGLVSEHTSKVNNEAPKVVAATANFYDSLTEEQRATLRERFAEFREDHHRHHRWGW